METHTAPPQGATPTKRKREAKTDGAGNAPDGRTTSTEQPKPTARATEPHEPEPPPPKVDDTRTEDGHAPSGKATSKPRAEAQEATKAAERLANEARATRPPIKNEETENTEADGKAERTRLSTPEAQPTETEPEKLAKTGKKARQETEAEEPKWREPEKATEPKEQTKEESETMIKKQKMNANYQRAFTKHQNKGDFLDALYYPCWVFCKCSILHLIFCFLWLNI